MCRSFLLHAQSFCAFYYYFSPSFSLPPSGHSTMLDEEPFFGDGNSAAGKDVSNREDAQNE